MPNPSLYYYFRIQKLVLDLLPLGENKYYFMLEKNSLPHAFGSSTFLSLCSHWMMFANFQTFICSGRPTSLMKVLFLRLGV